MVDELQPILRQIVGREDVILQILGVERCVEIVLADAFLLSARDGALDGQAFPAPRCWQ